MLVMKNIYSEKYLGASDYDLYFRLADNNIFIYPAPKWLGYYYRWHDKQDIENAGTLLPLTSNPIVSEGALAEMKKKITDRQVGRVWVVGSSKITAPLINTSFRRFLTIMEKHFSQYPFLFGNRPSSADFSFFGQLSQLVGFDPTPRSITQKISMRTVAWVDRTEDLSGLDPSENDWLKLGALPNTIITNSRVYKLKG